METRFLLGKKIRLGISVLIVLVLFAYLMWEVYWYRVVQLGIIRWHTHLMIYVYAGLALALLYKALAQRNMGRLYQNLFLTAGAILFSLFMAEACLTITGSYKTYMEKLTGWYTSRYAPTDKSQYHLLLPGKEHWLTKPEYSYWRPTSSMRFADREWDRYKKPGQKRILALGDSFTEGDGAPFDSSYVALLRGKLPGRQDSFDVMNAGICGSDPFDNYIIYKDLLQPYQPDIIIQSLGSDDITNDMFFKGGLERFRPDGTLKYTSGPWWEPLYAESYVSRIFIRRMGYDEVLRKGGIDPAKEKSLNEGMIDLFDRYADLCRQRGTKLIIVLHPLREEVERNQYQYDFSAVLSHLAADSIKVIDLLPAYRSYIAKNHTEAGDYYWKGDGHHNSKGYEMMAETTLQNIMPLLKDSTAR